jgi:flagella basal body P-ring formation protein FlgA
MIATKIKFIQLRTPGLLFWLGLILAVAGTLQAQGERELVLRFRESPAVTGNLVRLGDLIEIRGDDAEAKKLADIALVPRPEPGTELRWKKEDILQQLQFRNYSIERFRWIGTTETVLRSSGPAVADRLKRSPDLTPAFATDRSFIQAERNLTEVLNAYLTTKSSNLVGAKFQFQVPKEYIDLFYQRRNIKAVGGGAEPWVGEQQFTVRVLNKNEMVDIPVNVVVAPPVAVVVANTALRRGDIIEIEDLRLQVINETANQLGDEKYFSDPAELLGKQLKRAMSSGQAIREEDVGPPIVIEKNRLVTVQVVMGGVTVSAAGRAITEGAIGDLIQVETVGLSSRKKLNAQVIDSDNVQVIAAGMSSVRR